MAAISSPHPTTTTVSGDRPVAAAKEAVTGPTGYVPAASSGSIRESMPAASSIGWDHERVRGSRSASDDAFGVIDRENSCGFVQNIGTGGISLAALA